MLHLIKKFFAPKGKDPALNDLERLFDAAMRAPAGRPAFYAALLEAELCVSGRLRPGSAGELDLQFYDIDGEKVLPVFSDAARLKTVLGPEAPVLRFRGRDLFTGAAAGQALALNPYSDHGREFSAAEIREILGGQA